jgi:GNAT superfamily N-acetyltransferase
MARDATPADLTTIVRLVARYHQASPVDRAPFDQGHTAATVSALIDSPTGHVGVMGDPAVGVLMASASPWLWGPGLVADEILWWVDPEARGKGGMDLLRHYERWAEEIGVVMVGVSALDGRLPPILRRRGYSSWDRKYGRIA